MNNLMPKMIPTFLPMAQITTVFEDQYRHIIKKSENYATTCLLTPDSRQAIIYCPPGSGKTTAFIVDLVWRIADLAKKFNGKNQLLIFTSPDDSINQDVYKQLKEVFDDNDKYGILADRNLNFYGLYEDPKDVKGRELEIVACSIQKLTGDQHERLKKFKITALISDEAHRGLGCTDSENYIVDIGYSGSSYEAKWYWKCRELDYDMWFGLTGTPTKSQLGDIKNYVVISKDMEKSDWRLPFFNETMVGYNTNSYSQQIEDFFKEVSQKNAIGKYLKSKINNLILALPETKITGLIKCGTERADVSGPLAVVREWDRLCDTYDGKTFEYNGVQLPYHIGKCAILTCDHKTGGSNSNTISLLNDEDDDYIAVAVIYIGGVGINITNLGVVSILPLVENPGDVDNALIQLMSRLDRCKFVWRGSFANEVAKINDPEQRKLMVKLAVNTSIRKCLATKGALAMRAYDQVRNNHVLAKDAEGFLIGLVSVFREHGGYSSVSGKKRDLAYKNARKDRCEHPDCTCYKELVENSTKKSKAERELAYQQILQVDHIDGDRDNIIIENLITLCPNRHSIKTMNNEDYLNSYDEAT